MDTRQLLEEAKAYLQAYRWGGVGDPVFALNSVRIGPLPTESGFKDLATPACLLRPVTATVDPEHDADPRYIQQEIEVAIVTAVKGDRFGTKPLMGAHRTTPESGKGRGVLEIQDAVTSALNVLPIDIHFSLAGGAIPDVDPNKGYIVTRGLSFRAYLTTFPVYWEVNKLTGSQTAGTVNLAWEAPDFGNDFVAYEVRRFAGSRPTVDPANGAVIPVNGTTATDTPGTGLFTYSVWATYADEGGSIALHRSGVKFVSVDVP